MIKTLQRFKYYYFSIYCVIFYSFFINLNCKRDLLSVYKKTESSALLVTYTSMEIYSKENKILSDLKYKNMIYFYPLHKKSFSYTLDVEGKILGHRAAHDQKLSSNATINLNKKLLNSTVFGSIKLIKI